jgi:hypothetical protein
MTVVRRLGAADDVAFRTGLGGVDGMTYGTVAILFRPSPDPVWRWLVKLHDISGVELGGIGVLSDSRLYWAGESIWWTEGPSVTFGDWHRLIARKNTGDVRPRFSLKNIATGIWVHADATETQLDWLSPSGGSVRTNSAALDEGPNGDFAAVAFWANELPWAADASGDAAIEATPGLDEHLDNWRDQNPSSGWAFSQTDANTMVEDWTLNRADETSAGVGTPTTVTDLDFVYGTAGILALSRNFFRSTQDEPGATGIIRDLSETQGSSTTLGSGAVSGGFVEVLRFWRTVDATVDASVPIDTSVAMSAVSASTLAYRWRVQRYNSADVLQESSTFSSEHNTVGVKTQTMTLAGPFAAGDKLALSVELRKTSGGGSRNFTLSINHPNSWVEFSVAETLPEEHSGNGTAAGITLTADDGTGTPATSGAGQAADVALTPAAGAGTPTVTGTGTPASLTLTAGTGTGSAGGEEHSGAGTAAGLTLTANTGTGTLATTGTGQATELTLTAGTGTGMPAVTASGTGTGLTLAAQSGAGTPTVTTAGLGAELTLAAGLGQGGTGTEQHSGSGVTATLVLVAGQGGGSLVLTGGGLTCTLELAAAPGAGSLATAGAGVPAVLLLVAGLGLDVLAAAAAGPPPEQRIYRVPGEGRAYRVPTEDRTYRIVR